VDGDELERVVSAHGLTVPAIGTGQAWGEEGLSFTDPDPAVRTAAIERTRSHIPFAAQTGAIIIIGLLRGTVRPGVEHAQAMEWLVDALQQCCTAAQPHGVRLALEPLNRYETDLIHTVAEGLDLIERVEERVAVRPGSPQERGASVGDLAQQGSPQGAGNLGLLLDTFHMNIEERDLAGAIRAAGERLFHFHVADSNRWYPGDGHVDFGHLLAVLEKIGYTGYVSGEFMPLPDAETAAEQAIAHLRAVAPSPVA